MHSRGVSAHCRAPQWRCAFGCCPACCCVVACGQGQPTTRCACVSQLRALNHVLVDFAIFSLLHTTTLQNAAVRCVCLYILLAFTPCSATCCVSPPPPNLSSNVRLSASGCTLAPKSATTHTRRSTPASSAPQGGPAPTSWDLTTSSTTSHPPASPQTMTSACLKCAAVC